jgi:hypothetical protein
MPRDEFRITYTVNAGEAKQARIIAAASADAALATLGPVYAVHTITMRCRGYKIHDGGSRCGSWSHNSYCPRHDPALRQPA